MNFENDLQSSLSCMNDDELSLALNDVKHVPFLFHSIQFDPRKK